MRTPPYLEHPPPIAFAHRGGAKVEENLGIENSLAAFSHAYELGYRYMETDVRCSRDGVVYACHDELLDRLLGTDDAIADLDSATIDRALLGDREPIVRFETLVEALPDARWNIDVKADDAVDATTDLVERLGILDRICLASFSHARLVRMRARHPGVVTSASSREVAQMVLTRRVPAAPLIFQVPVRHGHARIMTPGFLRRAHRAGKHVHVWTVDDPQEMHRLADLGVDGIMTDRTDLLKNVLLERGQWKDPA
ncbi:glycerophosphodiester phosphodiesterase family protein [Aeromicrobium duanguangcaii]|uniref:Glycerophosphodiester phosphodiesterase n=1 Tax=Aeromicrobium duanguangcaii TaxID=2968086 RepID=A0ABY5KBB6_9ACTN|nr:glycerophosphodiester phosphodiesterase family protein [Aeromicrobium duanguangcaii]MCD9152820.1 glycerophosphodiester phosphodiesterase [Aeromicrobium duanguangcaii]MCL3837178.1 glycerophosphodiester phosphodiesterase [Aeromicrobium duanguangcaii]UUI67200.1 glycerophosphodiester phosphodiesterase [Aeromicrobium duanguangcaii]